MSPTAALISSHDEKAIIRMITEQETAEKDYGKNKRIDLMFFIYLFRFVIIWKN